MKNVLHFEIYQYAWAIRHGRRFEQLRHAIHGYWAALMVARNPCTTEVKP
jgi:hypothetical protein